MNLNVARGDGVFVSPCRRDGVEVAAAAVREST